MAGTRPRLRVQSLHYVLRNRSVVPAREVLGALDVPPATLSRVVAADRGRTVLRTGAARATRYSLIRQVRDLGGRWPIFRVDRAGAIQPVGELVAGQGREYFVVNVHDEARWLTLDAGADAFSDLPWYLQDLRPAGFLGRAFARAVAAELGVPSDPRDWSADDQLTALVRRGDDLPGDLVVGEAMARAATERALPEPMSSDRYVGVASLLVEGGMAGSSAAGEQPKFTVYAETDDGPRHLLVKFATMATENGRRAADLLVAEHLALETLAAAGLPAARSRTRDVGGMRFLEVNRFDRLGAQGRRSAVSLSVVDAEFTGVSHGWTAAARALAERRVITAETARAVALADAFGAAIANTDRHLGNVSFHFDTTLPAALCPVYDMGPMAFAAGPQGPRPYAPVAITWPMSAPADVVAEATTLARAFWLALGEESRVSAELRAVAMTMAEHVS